MIIKFGTLVVGARGTIGGATLSANGSGPYAKAWSRSGNPRTDLQSTRRSYFSILAPLWQGLTSGQRDDWDTYAADTEQELTNSLGETYFASGFNWFISVNAIAKIGDFALRLTAPTSARPTAPTLVTFTVTTAPLFSIQYALNEFVGFRLQLSMAKAFSEGVLAKPYDLKWLLSDSTTGSVSEIFTDEAVDAFGDPQIGDRYFLHVTKESLQSRRSTVSTISKTVVS